MAYRLERDESVTQGLRRVIREEMESAAKQLAGKKATTRDEAIHEARKNIKKVRALLRLASASLGATFETENERLREIARKLSDFRDALVIIQTFDSLKEKYKREMQAPSLKTIRAGLTKRSSEAQNEEDIARVLNDAAAALRKGAKRVKTWPLPKGGFESLAPGLEATYRAGKKALSRARNDPAPENFHQLRKRVKDHWYHIRLLESLWTEMMVPYEKSLKDLETWLGEDHNLAVLRDKITAEPAFYGTVKDTGLTLGLIDEYQEELRRESISLADRIYEEKPREFVRRMKGLWETWQREPDAPAAA